MLAYQLHPLICKITSKKPYPYITYFLSHSQVAKLFSFTWTFGALACKLLYYLQSVSGICSVLNLTALSFER